MQLEKNLKLTEIQSFLQKIDFIKDTSEKVLLSEVPGEGNMNIVLRIKTNKRSFILKQSKPYVQKYKDIPAPVNRIISEYEFYKAIKSENIELRIPKLLAFFETENLIVFEDLGNCNDFTEMYNSREFSSVQLSKLLTIIAKIHQTKVDDNYPKNKGLRALNYQHIFEFPFDDNNGFSLDTVQKGLEKLALPLKNDEVLKKKIKQIGSLYLSEGNVLLHGDFYPGSWMKKQEDIYVLDPEFTFLGFAEFDLGVMAAHIIMATMDLSFITKIAQQYPNKIDEVLLKKVTGIEIMRRIIGLAQLPLNRSLQEKDQLLKMAYSFIN